MFCCCCWATLSLLSGGGGCRNGDMRWFLLWLGAEASIIMRRLLLLFMVVRRVAGLRVVTYWGGSNLMLGRAGRISLGSGRLGMICGLKSLGGWVLLGWTLPFCPWLAWRTLMGPEGKVGVTSVGLLSSVLVVLVLVVGGAGGKGRFLLLALRLRISWMVSGAVITSTEDFGGFLFLICAGLFFVLD